MHVKFVISCFAVGVAAMPTGVRTRDGEMTAAEATSLSAAHNPSSIVARSPDSTWGRARSKVGIKKKKKLADLEPEAPRPPKNFDYDREYIVEGPRGETMGTAVPIRPGVRITMEPTRPRPARQPSPPPPQQPWVPDPSYQPEDPDTWENDVPPSQQAIQAVEDARNGVYNPLHAQQDYHHHGGGGGSHVDYDYDGHAGAPSSYVAYDYDDDHGHGHHYGSTSGHGSRPSSSHHGAGEELEPWDRPEGGYFWEAGASPVYAPQGSQQGGGVLSSVVSGGSQILRAGARMVSSAVQQYQNPRPYVIRPVYPGQPFPGPGYHVHPAPGHGMPPGVWVYSGTPGEGPPGEIRYPSDYD